jgi:replicative superfamily II helicase
MDEMHALGALFNGYLLEILISKVLYLEHRVTEFSASRRRQAHTDPRSVKVQLIAMSATVGNVAELAAWFGNTQPFISDYRPVVLFEKIVAGDQCSNRKGNTITEKLPLKPRNDRNDNGR